MNNFAKTLIDIGIPIQNEDGSYRNFIEIIDDLSTKWNQLDYEQKDIIQNGLINSVKNAPH